MFITIGRKEKTLVIVSNIQYIEPHTSNTMTENGWYAQNQTAIVMVGGTSIYAEETVDEIEQMLISINKNKK